MRAVDRSGNLGDYSELRSFRIGNLGAPGVPVPLFPRDGVTGSNPTPSFKWGRVSDPRVIFYTLEIATGSQPATGAFNNPVFKEDQIASNGFSLSADKALGAGDYKWHVQAVEFLGGQTGDFSGTRTFRIAGAFDKPGVPVLESPTGDTASATFDPDDATPTFIWGESTGGNLTPLRYDLEVGKKGAVPLFGSFIVGGVFTGDITPDTGGKVRFTSLEALDTGDYVWQVRARDEQGNTGDFSKRFTFTIVADTTKPVVALISPTGTADSARPTFVWTGDDSNPLVFNLRVSSTGDFSKVESLLINVTGDKTSLTPRRQLPAGTFFWRVEATDSFGNTAEAQGSSWGPTRTERAPFRHA